MCVCVCVCVCVYIYIYMKGVLWIHAYTHNGILLTHCSASLIIRQMQISITVKYHLMPVRMAVIKKTTNKYL